jgi:hypothetical protein
MQVASLQVRFTALVTLLLLIGCQNLSNSAKTALPQLSSPAALKQPKFLFVAGELPGGTGAYQVFSVDQVTGGLKSVPGALLPDDNVAKEINYQASTQTLYVSTTQASLIAGIPWLHVLHFSPSEGSLSLIGQLDESANWSNAITPDGRFVYANGFEKISAFATDATSGLLTPLPTSPYPTNSEAQWMLRMHLSGRYMYGIGLYTLNPPGPNGSNVISHLIGFALDPNTGAPSMLPGFPLPQQLGGGLAIHPSGKFVFATGLNALNAYQVDPSNGALKFVGSSPFDGRNYPSIVPVVNPSGKFVFLCCTNNQLFGFRINQATGAVTQLDSSPIAVSAPETDPEAPIALSGGYLFLGQGGVFNPTAPAAINVFHINDDGSLSLVAGSPFPTAAGKVKALAVAEE